MGLPVKKTANFSVPCELDSLKLAQLPNFTFLQNKNLRLS